ncbi:MAG: F0F1 ATP synthase subunit epsilon [Gammaproteobacteria bacterium]
MNQFILNLYDNSHELTIDSVTSFIGEDLSGSFGIWPNHARFMTVLVFGLARFRQGTDGWRYLALPGGVLYFHENELTVSTRHFLIDPNLERISGLLEEQLIAEEENLRATRESLQRMEQAVLMRMLALQRKTGR